VTAAVDDAPAQVDGGGLAGLGLAAEDLRALARQGFVAAEARRGRGPYYKLRWRRGGRQRVRYLGRDPGRAARARAALEALQRPLRAARLLARLLGEARRRLREARRLLTPRAEARGLRYHGYTARRPAPRAGRDAGDLGSLGCCPSHAREGIGNESDERGERSQRGGAGGGRGPGGGGPDPRAAAGPGPRLPGRGAASPGPRSSRAATLK
jgi:hypothetical protein